MIVFAYTSISPDVDSNQTHTGHHDAKWFSSNEIVNISINARTRYVTKVQERKQSRHINPPQCLNLNSSSQHSPFQYQAHSIHPQTPSNFNHISKSPNMQFQLLFGAFLALASTTTALPSPTPATALECWATCSTSCVYDGSLRGGLCSADGTCTCLTGLKERTPAPEPQSIECWSTCSTDCVQGGNIRGGLCAADGSCVCLTGVKAREAAPAPQALECWATCSTGCVQGGSLRGGLCSADGYVIHGKCVVALC